jgi:hypothetical protein
MDKVSEWKPAGKYDTDQDERFKNSYQEHFVVNFIASHIGPLADTFLRMTEPKR